MARPLAKTIFLKKAGIPYDNRQGNIGLYNKFFAVNVSHGGNENIRSLVGAKYFLIIETTAIAALRKDV
nr:hypothetical protein [Evansella caseinilytica]